MAPWRVAAALALLLDSARALAPAVRLPGCRDLLSALVSREDASLADLCSTAFPDDICTEALRTLGPAPFAESRLSRACEVLQAAPTRLALVQRALWPAGQLSNIDTVLTGKRQPQLGLVVVGASDHVSTTKADARPAAAAASAASVGGVVNQFRRVENATAKLLAQVARQQAQLDQTHADLSRLEALAAGAKPGTASSARVVVTPGAAVVPTSSPGFDAAVRALHDQMQAQKALLDRAAATITELQAKMAGGSQTAATTTVPPVVPTGAKDAGQIHAMQNQLAAQEALLNKATKEIQKLQAALAKGSSAAATPATTAAAAAAATSRPRRARTTSATATRAPAAKPVTAAPAATTVARAATTARRIAETTRAPVAAAAAGGEAAEVLALRTQAQARQAILEKAGSQIRELEAAVRRCDEAMATTTTTTEDPQVRAMREQAAAEEALLRKAQEELQKLEAVGPEPCKKNQTGDAAQHHLTVNNGTQRRAAHDVPHQAHRDAEEHRKADAGAASGTPTGTPKARRSAAALEQARREVAARWRALEKRRRRFKVHEQELERRRAALASAAPRAAQPSATGAVIRS